MSNSLSTGPRILCLDGGGMRGLSEIRILKELMLQVRLQTKVDFTPEPWQCFDLICGTSTGGLLAVLLGRLGKTLDECEAFFREFGPKIFAGGSVKQKAKLTFTGSKHATENLKAVIVALANGQLMVEGSSATRSRTPVAVVAVSKTTKKPDLFRTYGIRAAAEKCTIVDACLATSAATTFFDPITINGTTYVDGGFGHNNPSSFVLDELRGNNWLLPMQDPFTEVGCFVSVGTGRPTYSRDEKTMMSHITPKGVKSLQDAAALCVQIATDCHEAHLAVKKRFEQAKRAENYFRFDVDRGLEKIEMNESSDEALQHITSTSGGYLKEAETELLLCAEKLNPRTRGNTIRVFFEPFDVDADTLSEAEIQEHYSNVGFHGRLPSLPWTGRIAEGVFRVSSDREARSKPLINSLRYMPEIDGHYTDLRDCIVSVAVKTERPYLRNTGAGLIVRYVDTAADENLRGIVFLKEPGRCCSIFFLRRGTLNRQASFTLPPLAEHDLDAFETIKVKASGNRVTFMINGKVVAEQDNECREGSACVALIAIGPGTFYFDDLELWLTERDESLRSIA